MTIPRISPYILPSPDELPASKAKWTPEPKRAVLLVHDMQEYFLGFYDTEKEPIASVVQNVGRIREFCDRREVPVVFSAQPADPERANRILLNELWGPGLLAQPEKESISAIVAPRSTDTMLEKTRYSAFHRTDLREWMQERGRDQLWITGVFAHIGCMMTAFEAFMYDIKAFMISDALADFTRHEHDTALELVAGRCGVVLPTAALLRAANEDDIEPEDSKRTPAESKLRSELSRLLDSHPESMRAEDDMRDLGLDSVRMLELIESFQDDGVDITLIDVVECETFGLLLAAIEERWLQTGYSFKVRNAEDSAAARSGSAGTPA